MTQHQLHLIQNAIEALILLEDADGLDLKFENDLKGMIDYLTQIKIGAAAELEKAQYTAEIQLKAILNAREALHNLEQTGFSYPYKDNFMQWLACHEEARKHAFSVADSNEINMHTKNSHLSVTAKEARYAKAVDAVERGHISLKEAFDSINRANEIFKVINATLTNL